MVVVVVAARNEEDESDGAHGRRIWRLLWGACQRVARNDMLGIHGAAEQKMRAMDIGRLCLDLLRKLAAVRHGGRWLSRQEMGVKWEAPPLIREWKPSLQCGCKGWSQSEGIGDNRWRRRKRKRKRKGRRHRQEERCGALLLLCR